MNKWNTPALLLFHTPESVGLLPDGMKKYARISDDDDADSESAHPSKLETAEGDQEQEQEQVFSFTRAEAFRTLPVWLLMIPWSVCFRYPASRNLSHVVVVVCCLPISGFPALPPWMSVA